MNRFNVWAAVLILACSADQAWAAIGAGDGNGSQASIDYTGNGNGFAIAEDVFFDPTAASWIKNLENTGAGISSGQRVPIVETLTNVGIQAWTDWHEEVIGPIDTFGYGPATEFAFERESVNVYHNGNLLSEGLDYTLQFTEHPVPQPPPDGMPNHVDAGQHWQSVWLFFTDSSRIEPSDTLTIEKNIFETHFNGKVWTSELIAQIAEHPTVPEPAAWVLAGFAALGAALCCRRASA